MKKYILDKTEEILSKVESPQYESISIKKFLIEFDYATKYLSRFLKARGLIIYLILFKKAYFIEGNRKITIKLTNLGKNLLSDLGKEMSSDTVKKGINDLVRIGIVEKFSTKPGKANEYVVKLPSELREVKKLIEIDKNVKEDVYDDSTDDFYTEKEKKLEILKRDNYKCFYCLCELHEDDFYLDHIIPRSNGGYNWKSNLVSACRTCNTKKNADTAESILLENYRKRLVSQKEFTGQKSKLSELKSIYEEIKDANSEII